MNADWKPFSLHFKQVYDGGYRYLDRCGQVMMLLEERLDLMPEDVTPSGCKMILPEQSISLSLSTSQMAITQEFPADNGAAFIRLCQEVEGMVHEHFTPRKVDSTGFASKSFWGMASAASVQSTSLKISKGLANELVRDIDMVARQESVDCHFAAGSMDLHFKLEPVTFSSLTLQTFHASPLATATHRRRLERLNQRAARVNTSLSQVLMMSLDMVEFAPPENSLQIHFEQLLHKQHILQKRFGVS